MRQHSYHIRMDRPGLATTERRGDQSRHEGTQSLCSVAAGLTSLVHHHYLFANVRAAKQMMRSAKSLTMIVALLLIGCLRYVPIHNVDRAMPPSATHLSADRIRDLIIEAGGQFEWTMTPIAPGHLVATHRDGQLAATVDIYYSPTRLQIILKSSDHLFQTATTVHGHYNLWAGNLEKSIIDKLSAAS